jgi:hypothetical protein
MGKAKWTGWLALGVLALPAGPARGVDPQKIAEAIDRGVAGLRGMQRGDGGWPYPEMGATALAGLTLLECGVAADDPAVVKAANLVRQDALRTTHTYTISLEILLLDRLRDPADVALIESLTVRLLAGQGNGGSWSYNCPRVSDEEVRRLQAHLRRQAELVGRRELPKADGRRTVRDLPEPIQKQLAQILNSPPGSAAQGGDNSNTQFAALALWVARRHGLPVEQAMARLDQRFRAMQRPDGGWVYTAAPAEWPSEATMTCAGLLGLAVSYGTAADALGQRKVPDIAKDQAVLNGLKALSTTIDHPVGDRNAPIPKAAGKSYYFLWSLERVCMILDLQTIAKKDWYAWGAEILLANQGANGLWAGNYADSGADTCFALLFLKRSNLARDLTSRLRGRLQDEAVLHIGGVGGSGLRGLSKRLKPGIAATNDKPDGDQPGSASQTSPSVARKPAEPQPADDTPPGQLAEQLLRAPAADRGAILEKLRDRKGTEYTEALTGAIARLEGQAKEDARDALAKRLERMKAATLAEYLKDEEPEIRRAAALACASKELKDQIPALIPLLRDPSAAVAKAAHDALKSLSGQNLGPDAAAWQDWWKKQQPG